MWVVKGKTITGKEVEYKVPAGKDTDKAFVMALAFQEHGKHSPDDALTAETSVTWTSDNVAELTDYITLSVRTNYGVDKRVGKGEWVRHSTRAYRSSEAATEALESAASEYPDEKFRIVCTTTIAEVTAVSRNAYALTDEKKEEEKKVDAAAPATDAKADVKAGDAKTEQAGGAPTAPKTAPAKPVPAKTTSPKNTPKAA